MDLFLDFIQIFRRIMIILAQNKVSFFKYVHNVRSIKCISYTRRKKLKNCKIKKVQTKRFRLFAIIKLLFSFFNFTVFNFFNFFSLVYEIHLFKYFVDISKLNIPASSTTNA